MITRPAIIASAMQVRRHRTASPSGKVIPLNATVPQTARRRPPGRCGSTCTWTPDPAMGRLSCLRGTQSPADSAEAGSRRRLAAVRAQTHFHRRQPEFPAA